MKCSAVKHYFMIRGQRSMRVHCKTHLKITDSIFVNNFLAVYFTEIEQYLTAVLVSVK
jgi:hypothetical protein